MSGQICPAPVERKISPPATECWPAAVSVLQIREPEIAVVYRAQDWQRVLVKTAKSQEGTRRIIGIGDASGQVRPAPTAPICSRVRMAFLELLVHQPFNQFCPLTQFI